MTQAYTTMTTLTSGLQTKWKVQQSFLQKWQSNETLSNNLPKFWWQNTPKILTKDTWSNRSQNLVNWLWLSACSSFQPSIKWAGFSQNNYSSTYRHSQKILHSEKKGYQNGAPGVLLLQMVPFFSKGHSFFLNSTPKGTILPTVK